jgi:hypothetical protein
MEIKNVIAKVKEWSKTLDPDEQAVIEKVLDKALSDEDLQRVTGGQMYSNAPPPKLGNSLEDKIPFCKPKL